LHILIIALSLDIILYFQTETLAHYSSYTEQDLVPTMQKLASLVIKNEDSKLKLTVSI